VGHLLYKLVPYPGVCTVAITVIATVLTVRPMGTRWRWGCVSVICVLSLFEFGAIAKERRSYQKDRADEAKRLQHNFDAMFKAQKDDFDWTLQQAQRDFSRTIQPLEQLLSGTDVLLSSSQQIANGENEINQSMNGYLLPGSTATPSLKSLNCVGMDMPPISPERDYFLLIGGSTWIVDTFPFIALSSKDSSIQINKSGRGYLLVDLEIQNMDGTMVARCDEYGCEVSPRYFKRHPDKSTLIVDDVYGRTVFKEQYLNPHCLVIEGKVLVARQWVDIPGAINGMILRGGCSYHYPVGVMIR